MAPTQYERAWGSRSMLCNGRYGWNTQSCGSVVCDVKIDTQITAKCLQSAYTYATLLEESEAGSTTRIRADITEPIFDDSRQALQIVKQVNEAKAIFT